MATVSNPDAVLIRGSKPANSYLYINGIRISEEDAPYVGVSWSYTLEYPEPGVNGFRISIQDINGNRSPAITYSYIYQTQNIESISIACEDLLIGNALTSVKNKRNIDFSPIYGIDTKTGKSVIVSAFIKVA